MSKMDIFKTCLFIFCIYTMLDISLATKSARDENHHVGKTITRRTVETNNQTNSSYYGDEHHPATSCQEIFARLPSLPSGVYWLRFLKIGNNETFHEQHYCENDPPAIKAQNQSMEQADPTQPMLPGAEKEDLEDLTVGQLTKEPQDPEHLNEQEQWPRPIKVPTEEEIRQRLKMQGKEKFQGLANKEKSSNGSSDQRSIGNEIFENATSVNEKNGYQTFIPIVKANATLESKLLPNTSMTTVDLASPFLENATMGDSVVKNETLQENQTNGAYFASYNDSYIGNGSFSVPAVGDLNNSSYNNQTSSVPVSETYFSSENNSYRWSGRNDSNEMRTVNNSVRMVLLNWKRVSSKDQKEVIAKKEYLHKASFLVQNKIESERTPSSKQLEREAIFVKPGLNRGVIQTSIFRGNGTLLLSEGTGGRKRDKDMAKKAQRLLAKKRDEEPPTGVTSPDSRQMSGIGGELQISQGANGDPIKKPNPDELHSGLWTTQAERYIKEAMESLKEHHELAKKLGGMQNVYDQINELNKNQGSSHDSYNSESTKKKLKEFYNSSIGSADHESKGSRHDQNSTVQGLMGEMNIKAPETNSKPEFEARTKDPVGAYYIQNSVPSDWSRTYPSMQSQTSSNTGSQSQTQSHSYAEVHAGSSSSAKSSSGTKGKSQSQINMERTQAQLAEYMKKNKQRIDEETENNVLHKFVVRPEKTAVDKKLENISNKLKQQNKNRLKELGKDNAQNKNQNDDQNKVEAIVNINYKQPPGRSNKGVTIETNININNSSKDQMDDDFEYERVDNSYRLGDWVDGAKQNIPNTAQLNSRLNTMPYARYKP